MEIEDTHPAQDNRSPRSSLDARLLRGAVQSRLFSQEPAAVTLGRFVVLERVGHGGMGVVYAAYDPSLDRRVAVKVLHTTATEPDASARRRLHREAKAMAKLAHPNVATVHEVGTHEGRVFLAMEYIAGGTLLQWCECNPPGTRDRFAQAADFMLQVGQGLAAAHAVGLVHRDLKPHNILLAPRSDNRGSRLRAVVGDFGLARFAEPTVAGSAAAPVDSTTDHDAPRTRTGAVLGTPAYMAPEQFEGYADQRSDQWGLCATFFEVLYGTRAFGSNHGTWSQRLDDGPTLPTQNHGTPAWMRRLLLRGMAREPADRFASVQVLVDALEFNLRPSRRRLGVAATGLLTVVGVGLVAASLRQPDDGARDGVRCDDGGDKIGRTWNEARKKQVRAAFEATGQPHWAGTWQRIESRLDTYALDWRAEHLAACEDTHVRHAQPQGAWTRRTRCLDQILEGVEITVDAFVNAVPNTVVNATEVSLSLPRPAECRDVDRPRTDAGPSNSDTIAEINAALRRASALGALDRFREAQRELSSVVSMATEIGAVGLHAEALQRGARLLYRARDDEVAESTARTALRLAEEIGDLERMARAWHLLSSLAARKDERESAEFRIDRALALARGANLGPRFRGLFLEAKAAAIESRSPAGAVADIREQALALVAEDGGLPLFVAAGSIGLAGSLIAAGRTERALAVAHDGLAAARELLAPGHPNLVSNIAQLAQLYTQSGRHTEAATLLDEALSSMPLDPGWDTARRLSLTSMRANIYLQTLEWDAAVTVLTDALAATDGLLPNDHREVRGARMTLATARLEQGQPGQALAGYEALGDYGDDHRVHPINRAVYWGNVAEAQARLGDSDAAIATIERARAALDQGGVKADSWRFAFQASFGEVYALAGQTLQAIGAFEQALLIADRTDVDAGDLAQARFDFARVLWTTEPERARTLAGQAHRMLRSIGSAAAPKVQEVQTWLNTHP